MNKFLIVVLLSVVSIHGMDTQPHKKPTNLFRSNSGTLLHIAVAWNLSLQVSDVLRAAPESINMQTQNGSTALHIAVSPLLSNDPDIITRRVDIIKQLLAHNIDETIKDGSGQTAREILQKSAFKGQDVLMEALSK